MNEKQKMKRVAVIFGGKSPEHDVSIVTALASVIKPLKLLGHEVVPIYVAKNGDWFSGEELMEIGTFQSEKIDLVMAKQKPLLVSFRDGMTVTWGSGLKRVEKKIDVVFPAMHGAYGEDGSLMGLLRMAGVAFVGCDMQASVVAMDKVLSKQVAEANGILTPKWLSFTSEDLMDNPEAMIEKIKTSLRLPVFVKPPHLGSSIGISKVEKWADLMNAIEVAAHYDDGILVEEGVENLIEVTVPIMGTREKPEPAMVERPVRLAGEVFDFESKYMHGGKKGGKGEKGAQGYSEIPAQLPGKLYDEALSVAVGVWRAVGMEGIGRVDLLIDEKAKKIYFNEINPMPGGLYAHNFARAGVSRVELVRRLLELAEESHARRGRVKTSFKTSYLKQF